MPKRPRNNESAWEVLQRVFRRSLPLETETTRYILVSALDVFMTYILLSRDGFAESNPVARFFLYGWGPRGMVYFKFGVVAFVCVLTQVIARVRLETARWLLNLATVVTAGVVIYSLTLLVRSVGLAG